MSESRNVVTITGPKELVDGVAKLKKEIAEQQKAIGELCEALKQVLNVSGESEGIAGWHLNGNLASWDEVLELDHFEALLSRYGGEE